jgi:hypothetical protein
LYGVQGEAGLLTAALRANSGRAAATWLRLPDPAAWPGVRVQMQGGGKYEGRPRQTRVQAGTDMARDWRSLTAKSSFHEVKLRQMGASRRVRGAGHEVGISFQHELGAFAKSGPGAEERDQLEVVTVHHMKLFSYLEIYIVSRIFLYEGFSRSRGRLVNSTPFRGMRDFSALEPGSQRVVRYARVSRRIFVHLRGSVILKDYVDLTTYRLLERPVSIPATAAPLSADYTVFLAVGPKNSPSEKEVRGIWRKGNIIADEDETLEKPTMEEEEEGVKELLGFVAEENLQHEQLGHEFWAWFEAASFRGSMEAIGKEPAG